MLIALAIIFLALVILFIGVKFMPALDDLKLLGPRLDAVLAAMNTDVATAVAAQKAADDAANAANVQALADAKAAAAQAESDLAAEVSVLTEKVAALETAAGVAKPTPPTTTGLTVDPASATIAVGPTSETAVSVTGGTGAITASGLPSGITYDGSAHLVADGTQVAGQATVTFSDSSTPPLTGTLTLTVA